MIKRLFIVNFFTVLFVVATASFGQSSPQTKIEDNHDGRDQAGVQEALKGEEALASGDMDAALGYYLAAHELDRENVAYLSTVAFLGEELGRLELAIEFTDKAVQLAVASGDVGNVSNLNERMARLLGVIPQAVQQKISAVQLAVASGDVGNVSNLNEEIYRLLEVMPRWVKQKINDASQVSTDQQPGHEAWLEMSAMAHASEEQGDFQSALDDLDSVVMIAEDVFGASHWLTGNSYRDFGYMLQRMGKPDEAEQFYSRALTIAEQALGVDHPQTVEIQELLAELYEASSAFKEAGAMRERMSASYHRALGSNHAFTLEARLAVARNLENRGLHAEASELLSGVCDLLRDTFGLYHRQALDCFKQQASLFTYQGKMQEAEAIYDELVVLMASSFPGLNSYALDNLTLLAEIYREQGRYGEAKELLSGVINAAKQIGNAEDAIHAKSYLARVFNIEGDYDRAESLTEAVLSYGQANWQNKPLNLLQTQLELGNIYQLKGKLGQAEVAFEEALQGFLTLLGDTHLSTLVAMNNLGQLYEKEGLYDLAEPILKDALATLEKTLGEEHHNTAIARNNLALLHESQGNFREAEPLYIKTLALLVRIRGDDHSETIAVRNNLAFLYMLMEDYDKAAPLFEQVQEQWTLLFGQDHQNTLKASNNLARLYHKQNRLAEAEQLFELTLERRKSVLTAEHLDSTRSMIDLGALYIDQGRFQEAEKLLQEALSLLEKVLGEQHPYTFEALNNLARAKESLGELQHAVELREQGFARRSQFLDRMLWVTGDNAREGYIRLHRPELDQYLSLVTRMNGEDSGLKVINTSLQRKGLLLKITSEIQQIAQLSKDPQLSELVSALTRARKELASLTLSGPTAETQGRHPQILYTLEREVNELQGELGRASARYKSSIAQISVDELAKVLEEDTVLIDFLAYTDGDQRKLVAGLLKKEGGEVSSSMIVYESMQEIEKIVLDYRSYIQDEDADEDEILEMGQLAYEKIWLPLQEVIGNIEHIYLIPDGILNILPFNALVDEDEEYLIQTLDLQILTSGRDLLPNSYSLVEGSYIILAGPDYDSEDVVSQEERQQAQGRRSTALQLGLRGAASGLRGLKFNPLPGAEQEGRLITDQVRQSGKISKVYFRENAQEQILSNLEEPPEILHIATHGFFLKADDTLRKRLLKSQRSAEQIVPPPGDNPLLRSGMAFAGINTNAQFLGDIDTDNDGILTALEVLQLNLTGTKLVVLSACETGLGEIHEGEGVYGLRRSFQEAGVAEVISSLWEVSDAGTQALMTDLYDRILAGEPARQALRATQLAMLDSAEWGYPYIWSAFMIVGSYESAGDAIQ